MPSPDRRPRTRRATEAPLLTGVSLSKAMQDAKGDPEAWAALRPQAIRGLARGKLSIDEATRIYDAYGRKPHFMPRLPPETFTDESNP
jgi:hypothetical protein